MTNYNVNGSNKKKDETSVTELAADALTHVVNYANSVEHPMCQTHHVRESHETTTLSDDSQAYDVSTDQVQQVYLFIEGL